MSMDIKRSPFTERLTNCIANIASLEERLAAEKALKNDLLTSMEKFYTDELKDLFFCLNNGKTLGQISHVFTKNSKLFVHLYFLEMTVNSKLTKRYYNFELFSDEMKKIVLLSETEYKDAFFEFVNGKIKSINIEGEKS